MKNVVFKVEAVCSLEMGVKEKKTFFRKLYENDKKTKKKENTWKYMKTHENPTVQLTRFKSRIYPRMPSAKYKR